MLRNPVVFSHEKLINPEPENVTDAAAELATRGNRRRLRVFLLVFLPLLIAGLVYTFARPPEYRAQARISVKTAGIVSGVPASTQRQATVSTSANGSNAAGLHSEAGILTSRPLIAEALAALRQQGVDLPEFGTDPVAGIQAALAVEPVSDTNIISLTAVGPQAAHLAAILNALIDVYSRRLVDAYSSSASGEIDTLRDELSRLNQRLGEKRKALEAFRQTADIVSGEREENQILARVKGMSNSLNVANEKAAQAEGRVRSIKDSLTAGKTVVRSRDNPTLAGLEARASQLRESLREFERTYTPQFMAMDPNVKGMRSRLADLEKQIAEQKASSGQMLLAEAEEELASARQAQQKLQTQIAEDRRAVHAFSKNFSTYKSMEQELAQIEASRSNLSERLLRTETSERSRMPSVQIIEAATTPQDVWRPDYLRDAGISVAVALVLALLAMALVELFNRAPPPSATQVVVPQSWITVGQELPALAGNAAPRPLLRPAPSPALLANEMALPRELAQHEVAGLLQTMPEQDAVWAALLLCGATAEEIRGITPASLDAESLRIRIQGHGARTFGVPPWAFRSLENAATNAGPEDNNIGHMPDSDEEVARRLLCAAHDAGLDDPAEITAPALRHTCIAYLVGQGLRFSDLALIVGTLPADELAQYAGLSPAGIRKRIEDIDPLMPALTSHG